MSRVEPRSVDGVVSATAVDGDPGAGGAAEAPSVIRVRHLNHYYGQGEARKQALSDNNLEVGPGEIVIMTGPSGSGKTTLLTLIGALRTVQEGSVEVMGQELTGLSPRQLVEVRKGIGFIFQAHNLFEALTAFSNVRMAMELKSSDRSGMDRRVIELLTSLGLGERLYYKPDHLSGGQRQRVAIARALANRPKLILADEPTAALDEESGRVVVNLLKRLAGDEQCTSLIVTHDNRILDVADRIVSLVDGKIRSNVLVKEMFPLCQFLRKCAAFSGLTPSALVTVAEKVAKEKFPAGSVIFRQAEAGDKFYLIWGGTVDVIDDQAGGTVLATLGPGEFFGEMALISGAPRTATVRARENLIVYSLGKADFTAALKASPSFEKELYETYFQRQ